MIISEMKKLDVAQSDRPLGVTSNEVFSSLNEGEAPSEELLKRLLHAVAHSIMKNELDGELPAEFTEYVDDFFNYSDMGKHEERTFDLGACWSMITMYRFASDESRKEKLSGEYDALIRRYIDIFKALDENPNMRHTDLAEKTKMKKPWLSHVMKELKDFRLVSSIKTGREKRYALTRQARERMRQIPDYSIFVKGARKDNDSAERFAYASNSYVSDNYVYSESWEITQKLSRRHISSGYSAPFKNYDEIQRGNTAINSKWNDTAYLSLPIDNYLSNKDNVIDIFKQNHYR